MNIMRWLWISGSKRQAQLNGSGLGRRYHLEVCKRCKSGFVWPLYGVQKSRNCKQGLN